MKVSHGQLEAFRANPAAFAAGQAGRHFGASMFRMWQYALKKVHSENVDAAADYLRQSIRKNFKKNPRNEKHLDELVDSLYEYAAAFASLGTIAVEVLKPISLVVSPKLTVTGEIARLDLVPTGGYAAFVFSREQGENWREQVRFPLIQAYFGRKLNCSLRDVVVGIYSVPEGRHEVHRFSAARVSAARSEITALAARLP